MDKIDIDALTGEISKLEEELIEKKRAVNTILIMMNEEPIYEIEDVASPGPGKALSGHEYYMKPLATAVTEILEKRRVPLTGEDIFEQLKAGGFELSKKSNVFKNTMISIGKNQKFHRLPNEKYGLREWYPDLDKKEPKRLNDKELSENEGGHEKEDD